MSELSQDELNEMRQHARAAKQAGFRTVEISADVVDEIFGTIDSQAAEIAGLRERVALKDEVIDGIEQQLGIDPLANDRTIGSEIAGLKARLVEAEKSRDTWRRWFHKTTADMMREGLVCLAGAVPTPEAGYMNDGGLNRMWADLKLLRKQRDDAEAKLAEAERRPGVMGVGAPQEATAIERLIERYRTVNGHLASDGYEDKDEDEIVKAALSEFEMLKKSQGAK